MHEDNENKCLAKHHCTFPWLVEFRCGKCFAYLGENIDRIIDNLGLKCPNCGCINKGSTSKISLDEYPRIIGQIENEVKEMEKR